MNFCGVEQKLGYTFKNKALLRRALTLSSADTESNNQPLEFFGDAVLEFIVSERIYDENASEGRMTERRKALVSDSALTPVSLKLGLDEYLIKGQGDTNNKKSVPSAYEAVVAAIYLDGGMDAARQFVISTLDFKAADGARNYKGELQEFLQARAMECPVYRRTESGAPHRPAFTVEVTLFGNTFTGVAESVRQAEQNAAQNALGFLKESGRL